MAAHLTTSATKHTHPHHSQSIPMGVAEVP